MGSNKNKKKKSLLVLIGTIVFMLGLICVIYFFPYVVANKNANGWFTTGKFAEVNVYPELAIKSYESAIARFPNDNSFPMSSIISVAKMRLHSLNQKLTGIDYPKVVKLLSAYNYDGLVKYFSSVNENSLKLSFFSPTEKTDILQRFNRFKKYLSGIQGFNGSDGDRLFSDKFKYQIISDLKNDLKKIVLSTKKQFMTKSIFFASDNKRLDAIFAKSLKTITELKMGANFYASLERLDDLASNWEDDISKIINNRHVGRIKSIARVDEKLTKDLDDFTTASSDFYKIYNKAGFDIRQMGDLKSSEAKLTKIKKDLMIAYKGYSQKFMSVVKYTRDFEKVTAQKIAFLSKVDAVKSELKAFEKMILGFDNSVIVYKKIYANMALRIKTVRKQRDSAKGAAKVRLTKQVRSLKKAKKKIELLVGFRGKVTKVVDAILALSQVKSTIMNKFSSGSGEVTANGIVSKMSSVNYLILKALLKKIFIADDKKRIIIAEVKREPFEQIKFLSLNLAKFSRKIIIKNIAVISKELSSGNLSKIELVLNKFGYFANFDSKYIAKKRYRYDYIKFKAGESLANAKSIVDKIISFKYFYNDNGYLGNRYETIQLNDTILIPVVKAVIAKAGLRDSKYRDLLEDLNNLK